MSLGEVVKNTLNYFKASREAITPELYRKVFCQEAKKLGIAIDDCEWIERFKGRLNPALNRLISDYRIHTIDEFLTFLISNLNRMQSSNKSEDALAAALVIKRLLLVIEAFPYSELSKEARRALGREMTHPAVLTDERTRWQQIQESLSFDFMGALDQFGVFDKTDLPELIRQIVAILGAQEKPLDLAPVAELLLETLRPTLAQANPDKLKKLEAELKSNAGLLTSTSVLSEIRELLDHRVLLDAEVLNSQTGELGQMVDVLKESLLIQNEQNDRLEVSTDHLTQSLMQGEFTAAMKEEFLALAKNTREAFVGFSSSIKERIGNLGELKGRIAALENELKQLRTESTEDFVTKIPNRRALTAVLEETEAAFIREQTNFALIFLQIDHYENLMDTLGLSSGEVILNTVAQFLKKSIQDRATLGRYGGNTFLLVFPVERLNAAHLFTQSLVSLMPRKRFLYEGRGFNVTLSGGAALRSEHNNLSNTLSHADACARAAKLSGGNQTRIKP